MLRIQFSCFSFLRQKKTTLTRFPILNANFKLLKKNPYCYVKQFFFWFYIIVNVKKLKILNELLSINICFTVKTFTGLN